MATYTFLVVPVTSDGTYIVNPTNNTVTAIETYLNAQGALGYAVVGIITGRDGQQKLILQKAS